MTKLGIMIEGQEGLSWDRWRRLCHDVEAMGFDSLWRSDHLYSVMGVPGREVIETWISLALAAEWTRAIEFGVLVSPMTFREPAVLAKMAASVDQLAGGRLVLGVGAGWYQAEHEMFSVPFLSLKQRMDRLERGIELMRRTWDLVPPRPARDPIPLLVAGSGEVRTLRIVAREASEWNMPVAEPEVWLAKTAVLDRYCKEIGRDPRQIKRSVMIPFVIGRDRDELRRRAAGLREVLPRFKDMDDDQVLEAAAGRWAVGTPSEVTEQLRAWADRGLDRLMLQHFLMDDSEALKLLADEVLPHL